jgi:hypothetical protein
VVQEAYEAHRGPRLLARYEDFRADAVGQLRAVVDWLGLDFGGAELDALVTKHSFEQLPAESRGATAFFRSATPGSWRDSMAADEQEVMLEVMGPKLRELGYDA